MENADFYSAANFCTEVQQRYAVHATDKAGLMYFQILFVFCTQKSHGLDSIRRRDETCHKEQDNRLVIVCIKTLKNSPFKLRKLAQFEYQSFSDKCLICLQSKDRPLWGTGPEPQNVALGRSVPELDGPVPTRHRIITEG